MNILFIGDIVGKLGRKVVLSNLPILIDKYNIDFVIANGENITKGKGITRNDYLSLKENGVDCITLGNHYNNKDEIYKFIENDDIVRPLNLKNEKYGQGTKVFEVNNVKIRVTNLLGSAFMKDEVYEPYGSLLDIICEDESDIHIVDFHAEATGEKKALAYSLKNTITAFLGTHTHVQTNDAQILNTGVAYISDVGMCGGYNSVLGFEIDSVVEKMIKNNDQSRFKILDEDELLFNAVLLKIDDIELKCKEIIPISFVERMN